jgi:CRISPR system Cascade subunit CasD
VSEDFRWLVLRLEGPLAAFGGVAIDQVGVTRDFPAVSMLTGLIANALGWERTQWQAHQALQDRLVFAARSDRESAMDILTDTQNAQIEKNDHGWTTFGQPEGRDGNSYGGPHRRLRDYHTDLCMSIVLRLEPAEESPDLDAIADALDHPARPLFLGRKPCLPSMPIRSGEVKAASAYQALERVSPVESTNHAMSALWPLNEGPTEGSHVHRIVALPDLRNWKTGLHGGSRMVVEGTVVAGGGQA